MGFAGAVGAPGAAHVPRADGHRLAGSPVLIALKKTLATLHYLCWLNTSQSTFFLEHQFTSLERILNI